MSTAMQVDVHMNENTRARRSGTGVEDMFTAECDPSRTFRKPSPDTRIRELMSELEKERNEVKALTLKCERFKQDFNNYRDRIKRNDSSKEKRIKQRMVNDLLSVIDALDSAGDLELHKERGRVRARLIADMKGNLKMTYGKLTSILGLESIDPAPGDAFDGKLHMALDIASSGIFSDNSIVRVVRKGYLDDGEVIRPAEVVISRYTGPEIKKIGAVRRLGSRLMSFLPKRAARRKQRTP